MIGDGQFQAHLSECAGLLDELKLLEEWNRAPNKRQGAADFKGMTYRDVYTTCYKSSHMTFA